MDDGIGDRSCHYDFFGSHDCYEGVVVSFPPCAVPCVGPSDCEGPLTHHCERGCRVDEVFLSWHSLPRDLCEENRPKRPGDACSADADCEPQTSARYLGGPRDGDTVYLRCDLDMGRCVEADAPVVEGYLEPCGIEPPITAPGYRGVVETDRCPTGLCAYSVAEDCIRQGCTTECEFDGQCPLGSVCYRDGTCWPPPGDGLLGLECPEL